MSDYWRVTLRIVYCQMWSLVLCVVLPSLLSPNGSGTVCGPQLPRTQGTRNFLPTQSCTNLSADSNSAQKTELECILPGYWTKVTNLEFLSRKA